MGSKSSDGDYISNIKLMGQGAGLKNKDFMMCQDDKEKCDKPLFSIGIDKYLPFIEDVFEGDVDHVNVHVVHESQPILTHKNPLQQSTVGLQLSTTQMDLETLDKPVEPASSLRRVSSSPSLLKVAEERSFISIPKSSAFEQHRVRSAGHRKQSIPADAAAEYRENQISQLQDSLGAIAHSQSEPREIETLNVVCKSAPVTPSGSPKRYRKDMEAYMAAHQATVNKYGGMFRNRVHSGDKTDMIKPLGNIQETEDEPMDMSTVGMKAQTVDTVKAFSNRIYQWATTTPTKTNRKDMNVLAPTSF